MSDQEEAHVGPGGGCATDGRRAARERLSERALGGCARERLSEAAPSEAVLLLLGATGRRRSSSEAPQNDPESPRGRILRVLTLFDVDPAPKWRLGEMW